MFSCFGYSKKKDIIKHPISQKADLEPKISDINELRAQISDLSVQEDNLKEQEDFYQDLLTQYKILLNGINSGELENVPNAIEKFILKENYILKRNHQGLTAKAETLQINVYFI